MVGWLILDPDRRGWRIQMEWTQVRGMPLLCVRVPVPEGIPRRVLERRTGRAARKLARRGCRRVLTQAGFGLWPWLEQEGLTAVEAGELCRAMAAPLLLAALERAGIPAERAAVELRAVRVGRACFETAEQLCPKVRQLIVTAPGGGAELAHYLRAEYGVAALEGGEGRCGDATACFTPEESPPEGAFLLCGPRPILNGFSLALAEGMLPGEADPLALMALLWGEGRLSLTELVVDGAGNPLDRAE